LYHLQSRDEQFHFFTDTTNEFIEKYLPLRRVKAYSSEKPWITSEFKEPSLQSNNVLGPEEIISPLSAIGTW
jgi:hypothetical protein